MKTEKTLAQQWEARYYKIPAGDPKALTTWKTALEHSITKWNGLREKVLKKFGLSAFQGAIWDENDSYIVDVTGGSCALCSKAKHRELTSCACTPCPLYKVRGDVRCGDKRADETISPYIAFIKSNDPRPMLKWLRRARELVKTS